MKKTKKPFFTRFLEAQKLEEHELEQVSGNAITLKFPSDRDEAQTMKYPSDDDEGGIPI